MKLFDVYPLNDVSIVKALGSTVWDDKGNEYLDLYGGHAVISIGHTNPHWVKRIEDQLHKISFYSNSIKIPSGSPLTPDNLAMTGSVTLISSRVCTLINP